MATATTSGSGIMKSFVTLQPLQTIFQYTEPRVQRNINANHVESMVKDQKAEYQKWGCFSMLQSLTVAYNEEDGITYVLDGHHRIRAYKQLEKEGYQIGNLLMPLVIYNVTSVQELTFYYNMINKNMPIHPLDMGDDFAEYEKVLIDNMQKTFGLYIKHNTKTSRCPHISLNALKTHLAGRQLASKLSSKGLSIDVFWNKVLELNTYFKVYISSSHQLCPLKQKSITDCEAKVKGNKDATCYLGVWRKFEWLDLCINALLNNQPFSPDMNLACDKNTKTPIPVIIRQQVWKKVNKSECDVGRCYTCSSDLLYPHMECGHIKAHALGGDISVDNLMPVCKSCNGDMGIMDLHEYKAMIERMNT